MVARSTVRSVTERSYKIDELARASGMSVRTVRYYVQRGLLPAAAFRGKDTAYEHGHLVRLRAIRRLQEAFFPLDAIAVELDARPMHEIEAIADGRMSPVSPLENDTGPGPGTGTTAPTTTTTSTSREARHEDDDARAEIARQASRLYRRIELFPGVDLTVAEDAPDRSVRLVKEMLAILEAKSKGHEGGRKR
jgi:DNA-binding transcriptional MerR regulator